jgi:hypothetical protein
MHGLTQSCLKANPPQSCEDYVEDPSDTELHRAEYLKSGRRVVNNKMNSNCEDI